MGVTSALVLVMCLGEDPDATRALAGISAALREPQDQLPDRLARVVRGRDPGGARAAGRTGRTSSRPATSTRLTIYAELPDSESEPLEL